MRQRAVDLLPARTEHPVRCRGPRQLHRARHQQHQPGRPGTGRAPALPQSRQRGGVAARTQSSDGGFPYLGVPDQGSDPDSTALSIQAILAEHRRPAASSWVKYGATPYDACAAYQLGRSDPIAYRGAFYYPPDRTPNVFATVHAVFAAADRTLPVKR